MAITKVSNSVLKDLAVDTQNIVDDSVTNAKIADNSIDSEHYVDGSIDAEHLSDDSISYNKLADEYTEYLGLVGFPSGVIDEVFMSFSQAQVFHYTLTNPTTFYFANGQNGMIKDLIVTGDFPLTLPAGSKITGTYDGTVSNLIQILVTGTGDYWYSISQPQS